MWLLKPCTSSLHTTQVTADEVRHPLALTVQQAALLTSEVTPYWEIFGWVPSGHHSSLLSTIRALHGNSGQLLSTRHQFKLNETDKVLQFEFREPSGKEKTEPTDTSVASNCTDYHNYLTLVTLRSFKDGIRRNMRFWDPSFHTEDTWGTHMQLLQKGQTRAWKPQKIESVHSEQNQYFNVSVPAFFCIITILKPVRVEKILVNNVIFIFLILCQ